MTLGEFTGDEWLRFVSIGLCLVLVLSSLAARRLSLGFVLRSLIAWGVIIAVLFVAFSNADRVSSLFAKIGLGPQSVQGETVQIAMAPDGHFWARATINGVPRRMLVDSGATTTAISERTAAAAGIDISGVGLPVLIGTANGTVSARRASIDTLELGPLKTKELSVVVAPNFGNVDVLGMNFLSRLRSWRVEGSTLILVPESSGELK